jgi:hypothetical protein
VRDPLPPKPAGARPSRPDAHPNGTKVAQTKTRCNPEFLTAQANAQRLMKSAATRYRPVLAEV